MGEERRASPPLAQSASRVSLSDAVDSALKTTQERSTQKAAPRVDQNGVMKIGGQPRTVNFTCHNGESCDLTPFLPPYKPSQVAGSGANSEVRAAKLVEYGGLKGAAFFTKWSGSLPDLGFNPGEIVVSKEALQDFSKWPGMHPKLVTAMENSIRDREEIPFLAVCKNVGKINDADVDPKDKMAFMQHFISNLIHKPKHDGDRGGHYGSGPWSDPKSSLQDASRRDIERVKSGAPATDIADFDASYKLSEFVANEFGDCRPTNLLMAFALKAAGFGKDEDIQIVNVRCARLGSMEDVKALDGKQALAGQLLKEIDTLEGKIAAGKEQHRDTTGLENEKTGKEEQFYGSKAKGITG